MTFAKSFGKVFFKSKKNHAYANSEGSESGESEIDDTLTPIPPNFKNYKHPIQQNPNNNHYFNQNLNQTPNQNIIQNDPSNNSLSNNFNKNFNINNKLLDHSSSADFYAISENLSRSSLNSFAQSYNSFAPDPYADLAHMPSTITSYNKYAAKHLSSQSNSPFSNSWSFDQNPYSKSVSAVTNNQLTHSASNSNLNASLNRLSAVKSNTNNRTSNLNQSINSQNTLSSINSSTTSLPIPTQENQPVEQTVYTFNNTNSTVNNINTPNSSSNNSLNSPNISPPIDNNLGNLNPPVSAKSTSSRYNFSKPTDEVNRTFSFPPHPDTPQSFTTANSQFSKSQNSLQSQTQIQTQTQTQIQTQTQTQTQFQSQSHTIKTGVDRFIEEEDDDEEYDDSEEENLSERNIGIQNTGTQDQTVNTVITESHILQKDILSSDNNHTDNYNQDNFSTSVVYEKMQSEVSVSVDETYSSQYPLVRSSNAYTIENTSHNSSQYISNYSNPQITDIIEQDSNEIGDQSRTDSTTTENSTGDSMASWKSDYSTAPTSENDIDTHDSINSPLSFNNKQKTVALKSQKQEITNYISTTDTDLATISGLDAPNVVSAATVTSISLTKSATLTNSSSKENFHVAEESLATSTPSYPIGQSSSPRSKMPQCKLDTSYSTIHANPDANISPSDYFDNSNGLRNNDSSIASSKNDIQNNLNEYTPETEEIDVLNVYAENSKDSTQSDIVPADTSDNEYDDKEDENENNDTDKSGTKKRNFPPRKSSLRKHSRPLHLDLAQVPETPVPAVDPEQMEELRREEAEEEERARRIKSLYKEYFDDGLSGMYSATTEDHPYEINPETGEYGVPHPDHAEKRPNAGLGIIKPARRRANTQSANQSPVSVETATMHQQGRQSQGRNRIPSNSNRGGNTRMKSPLDSMAGRIPRSRSAGNLRAPKPFLPPPPMRSSTSSSVYAGAGGPMNGNGPNRRYGAGSQASNYQYNSDGSINQSYSYNYNYQYSYKPPSTRMLSLEPLKPLRQLPTPHSIGSKFEGEVIEYAPIKRLPHAFSSPGMSTSPSAMSMSQPGTPVPPSPIIRQDMPLNPLPTPHLLRNSRLYNPLEFAPQKRYNTNPKLIKSPTSRTASPLPMSPMNGEGVDGYFRFFDGKRGVDRVNHSLVPLGREALKENLKPRWSMSRNII